MTTPTLPPEIEAAIDKYGTSALLAALTGAGGGR